MEKNKTRDASHNNTNTRMNILWSALYPFILLGFYIIPRVVGDEIMSGAIVRLRETGDLVKMREGLLSKSITDAWLPAHFTKTREELARV